jgi:predicted polyphosphate/ATP-dependent NAD kinase
MKAIGIVANPASGKDIRRLVSHATVVDNHEKINIVERIILAAQSLGVQKVYMMPDTYQIGRKVEDNLKTSKELELTIEILDMRLTGSYQDSAEAARLMVLLGVGCVIVMGGDGTCRAVAKCIEDIPFIGLSTGTNNVYPQMIEGTVVGMAAAIMASDLKEVRKVACTKDKRIEIYKNGEFIDIALVDVVISTSLYVGAKAIWHFDEIMKVLVTRANPASIGFSAIVGCLTRVTPEDDFGIAIDLNEAGRGYMCPIAAGILKEIRIDAPCRFDVGERYSYEPVQRGMIALDGEREIKFNKGDVFEFKLTRQGPMHVNVQKAITYAQDKGFFKIETR